MEKTWSREFFMKRGGRYIFADVLRFEEVKVENPMFGMERGVIRGKARTKEGREFFFESGMGTMCEVESRHIRDDMMGYKDIDEEAFFNGVWDY
ncbi:hypothetical protein [Caulobacter phage Cr30]|uniref:hypothetical protein n=1 Tax=Caulobacter phage Cr30 TaxID=1357714 RepID=UPI0004A9B8AC|nr:hypothetical protein OZ74_gp236 [Caulobacter phage Cr30]AGS81107.1 hypothetical protein [Caulobacter phage Cr30]